MTWLGPNLQFKGWGRAGEEENIPTDVANQPWALRQALLPLVADQDCQVGIASLIFSVQMKIANDFITKNYIC